MSLTHRIYNDANGTYGTSGSYAEFTVPVKTSNIEYQDYGIRLTKFYDGDNNSSTKVYGLCWQYWNDSEWVTLYEKASTFIDFSDSDNTFEITVTCSEEGYPPETYQSKMEELSGKRVRWYYGSKSYLKGDIYLKVKITYKTPTISNPTFTRNFANKIVVVNTTIPHGSYEIVLNGATYTNTKSIPESAFKIGTNTITINAYNGDLSATTTVTYNFVDYNPTASSCSFVNTVLDNNTNIEVTAKNAQKYDLYVNGVYKETSSTSAWTAKKSSFVLGENKVFVRCYNTTSNRYVDTPTVTKNFTLIQPTLSNVTFQNTGEYGNNLTCNNTKIAYVSSNYSYFNIYANDNLIASKIKTLTYTALPHSLPKGQIAIKVEVVKEALEGIENTEICKYVNATLTLNELAVAISSFVIEGDNIDHPITVSWESNCQTSFALYGDDIKVAEGSTARSCVLPGGHLKATYSKWELQVYYNCGRTIHRTKATKTFQTTYDKPLIYNLEPSNLNKKIDEQISVTFATNDFCDRWELKGGEGIATGTTGRSVIFGSNTFVKGNNTLQLTIFYTPLWDTSKSIVRTATKTVTFFGYGVPTNPNLLLKETYATASPTLFWEQNEEQTAFEYTITKNDEVVAADEVISTDNYVSVSGLEDNTTYVFSLRIKNKWGLYSGYSVGSFTTVFSNITTPNFYLTESAGSVVIAINGVQDADFKSISVYRKAAYEPWVEIAHNCNIIDTITDSTTPCGTDVLYKLRVYNTDGAYKDTESKSINIMLRNYRLLNVENLDETFQLDFVKISIKVNTDFVMKKFTNRARPTLFKGKANYATLSLEVEIEREKIMELLAFVNESNEYNLFCFKSYKGDRKFVVARIDSYAPVNAHIMSVSMELTEIDFIETKMYSGTGYKKLVYLDGTYALDGSIDLSGFSFGVVTNA